VAALQVENFQGKYTAIRAVKLERKKRHSDSPTLGEIYVMLLDQKKKKFTSSAIPAKLDIVRV
jgi:hypothetical protein